VNDYYYCSVKKNEKNVNSVYRDEEDDENCCCWKKWKGN